MLFHDAPFLWLLLATCVAYWGVLRTRRARNLLLLGASVVFYTRWSAPLVLLVVATALYDYGMALAIEAAPTARGRRARLVAAVVVPLGLLAYFKYTNFLAAQVWPLFGASRPPPVFAIVLPLGISFYTFETIAYVIDVYRRRIAAERDVVKYALFLLFFPHLIAGPIVRPGQLLPQLRRGRPLDWSRVEVGVRIFVLGMLKKAAVADQLALIVDPVFARPGSYATGTLWTAAVSYAVQIYCDFSGYSDMAIGAAHLLGITLPTNFRMPYFAANPAEFWRRWHITLSTWLRDYLYIPLGGNRHGTLMTYRNLLLTMLLGGLWHGAAWKFIAWGMLHGGGLAVERMLEPWIGRRSLSPAAKAVATLVVFHFVCFAWIFFRAEDFALASLYIGGLASGWGAGLQQAGPFMVVLIALGLAGQFTPDALFDRAATAFARVPSWGLGAMAGIVVALINALGPEGVAPFIYFRF